MAVERVDKSRCTGCRTCIESCPMDVFRMDQESGKAYVRYPEECVLCGICLADCPADAIEAVPGKPGWMAAGY